MKVLILTDHRGHSSENSLYALARELWLHDAVDAVHIATRGYDKNQDFFECVMDAPVFARSIDDQFDYDVTDNYLVSEVDQVNISQFDLVWLRLPPPLSDEFCTFLEQAFQNQIIVNTPSGIQQVGRKDFLLNFEAHCAPMKICHTIEDVEFFKKEFAIVIKPFKAYGGKGIWRIDGDEAWEGTSKMSWDKAKSLIKKGLPYLGVKYLKNVTQGDKRVIVIDGEVIGASMRLPANDSWLCNVSMGGKSEPAEIDNDELQLIESINPTLYNLGILIYGIDTLVNDGGRRILSEINVVSVGGIKQLTEQGRPNAINITINKLINHVIKRKL